ncbi:MAG: S8 family serine peptidase [Elainellaceae cyanobacterium]
MINPFSAAFGNQPSRQPSGQPDSNVWARQLQIPVAGEGLTLQRGGEQIALRKVGDRFTVGFADPESAGQSRPVAQAAGGEVVQIMPLVSLTEVQVSEDDQLDPAMDRVRAREEVAFASHVYQVEDSPEQLYLTDQLTVQFKPDVGLAEVEAIAAAAGLARLEAIDGVPNAYVFQVTVDAVANPLKLCNRLVRLSPVLLAEPNVVVSAQGFYRPRDSRYPEQWYLQHQGGPSLVAGSHISVEAAWDITRGSRSIVVAVIDDGFDLNHPDFSGEGKLVAPRDLKASDGVPFPEGVNENHGTPVAAIAIAEENGSGIVGVAPGCAFMPIRYSGIIDDRSIEVMFSWAINNGADVISCSWGPVGTRYSLSLRQRAAITRAATRGRDGKGAVVVFAAGNANRPLNGTIDERGWPGGALQGNTPWLNGFAVHPDVIAVSACSSLNQKSAYSSWGKEVSVAAPSNNAVPGLFLPQRGFVNTGPAIRQPPGRGVLASDRLGALGYSPSDFIRTFGGTSSACPVVAGVAALMLSANPDLSAQQVRQILQSTADKIVDRQTDPQLGLRKGTYDAQGHSEWFGHGKVNALRAVRAAQQRLSAPQPVSRWLEWNDAQRIAIPDNVPQGIRRPINVSQGGVLWNVEVTLSLQHSFLGDVEINLIAPSGEAVRLQSRLLGRQQTLSTTYSTQTTPLLNRLLGQSIRGVWQLQLCDCAVGDVGELQQWRLRLGV